MWQRAEIPPEGTGISIVVSFFSPSVAIYPKAEHTPKAEPFYPSIAFHLAPTFITVARQNSKEVSQSRAPPLALLS